MITANYILVPVLIVIILFYIYMFYSYTEYRLNTIPLVTTKTCFLDSCDTSYYFGKSEDQL